MKNKPYNAIRELRKIIGQTQGEFAAMVGVSKDAVASWEIGRNNLSASLAHRIAYATGANQEELLSNRGPLTTYVPCKGPPKPLTAETFEAHRKSYWGRSDEAAARLHLRHCTDALRLLFIAAAQPGRGNVRYRLPAVLDSFRAWCESTRADFQLDPEIQEQLEQRLQKFSMHKSYREWRQMQKQDPDLCRAMGFKDDPRKRDNDNLELSINTVPLWRPGLAMWGPALEG